MLSLTGGGMGVDCVVLAREEDLARKIQYAVEDLGEDWRCAPATQAEQALRQLQAGVNLLLLQSGGESGALLELLAARPLLAPPYILGLDMDAPDGRLGAIAELPQRLQTWREQGRLPVLAKRHLQSTAEIAAALLRTMEVPRRLGAWVFLPEMAALTVVHPPLLQDLSHGLYPLIAARYGMTAAGVERRLRLCVESTWMHGSLDALERFFGSSVDPERGKPTNREFLCRVQERLTLTMQRFV